MALRWLEGFERERNGTILARQYAGFTGNSTMTAISGARGGSGASGDDVVLTSVDLLGGAADQNTWVAGFWFSVEQSQGISVSPNAIPYFAFLNSSGEQLRLEFIHAGFGTSGASKPGGLYYRLRVMRGATEIARSDQIWKQAPSGWVFFEFKATIDTAVGGSFSVRWSQRKLKDQVVTWDNSVSGINTANQGVAGADRFEVSWNTGTDSDSVAYDDIYVLDSTGSKNNDFLGEIYIEGLTISANGDTVQWSLVNGSSIEDAWNESAATAVSTTEDDKRFTSDTVGQIHLATLTDLVGIANTSIVGVQVRMFGKMESTGTRDIQAIYRKTTGSPAQVGGGILTVTSTSMTGLAETLEDDPNTGVSWLVADINGLQVGCELDA